VRPCAIVPAYEAASTVGDVVVGLRQVFPARHGGDVFVVDDGSRDGTAERARAAGARVLVHPRNRGKGAALRTGLVAAHEAGFDVAVTVDADGQHPPEEAPRLVEATDDPDALVLGVRDLVAAGAPRANQFGNRASNFWLSLFTRRTLADTQCGYRRYPVAKTLAIAPRDPRFGFEAEIILRAVRAGVPIVEVPVRVLYPQGASRRTHFRNVRDPVRIVARVVATLLERDGR
jgi:glycosyltransferase involved in cell wall biosynthesis